METSQEGMNPAYFTPGADVADAPDSTESDDETSPPDDSIDVVDEDVSDESGEDGDDEDEDDDDPEWEALRQKAAKADQLEAYVLQQQAEAAQRQAADYWNREEQLLENRFAQAWQQIQINAQQSLDPQVYLFEQSQALMRAYGNEQRTLRSKRETAIWNAAKAQSIPNFAAQVASEHGLTRDETQELLGYAPNQMERAAQRMVRTRSQVEQLQAEIQELKRQQTAHDVARRTVAPGGGRGVGRQIKKGSDSHLKYLLFGDPDA